MSLKEYRRSRSIKKPKKARKKISIFTQLLFFSNYHFSREMCPICPIMNEKQKQFIAVFEKHYGTVRSACASAKIARSTYYEWLKNEEFKQSIEEITEGLLDEAESKLHELINGVMVEGRSNGETRVYSKPPDFNSIKFFLSTKGKARGYTEKIETENVNKNDNTLKIVIDYGETTE